MLLQLSSENHVVAPVLHANAERPAEAASESDSATSALSVYELPVLPDRVWPEWSSLSCGSSRDSNKDSGTGTELTAPRTTRDSSRTLTPERSPSSPEADGCSKARSRAQSDRISGAVTSVWRTRDGEASEARDPTTE